jgi:hypothetical protein
LGVAGFSGPLAGFASNPGRLPLPHVLGERNYGPPPRKKCHALSEIQGRSVSGAFPFGLGRSGFAKCRNPPRADNGSWVSSSSPRWRSESRWSVHGSSGDEFPQDSVVKTRTLVLWFRQKWFVRLLRPTNQRPVPFGRRASSRSMARWRLHVPGSPLPPPALPRWRCRLDHLRYEPTTRNHRTNGCRDGREGGCSLSTLKVEFTSPPNSCQGEKSLFRNFSTFLS